MNICAEKWHKAIIFTATTDVTTFSNRKYETYKSSAVWACLGVDPLDMPRTPYRVSEGKRSH